MSGFVKVARAVKNSFNHGKEAELNDLVPVNQSLSVDASWARQSPRTRNSAEKSRLGRHN
jgi:hypothetical protein